MCSVPTLKWFGPDSADAEDAKRVRTEGGVYTSVSSQNGEAEGGEGTCQTGHQAQPLAPPPFMALGSGVYVA